MAEMTGKERMLTTLAHQEPDRVPVGEMGIDYPIIERILGHETFYRAQGKERAAIWAGRRDEVVASQKHDLVDLVRTLEWDFVPVCLTYSNRVDYTPRRFLTDDGHTWEDRRGLLWRAADEVGDALCIDSLALAPADLDEMLNAPLVVDESELELVRHVVRTLGEDHFIIGRGWHGPSSWTDGSFPLAGEGLSMPTDQFLVLLYQDPDRAHAILRAYTKRAIEYGLALIGAGVDAVQINADYCINTGPWLSPAFFAEFILPYMAQQVAAYKDAGALVLKHTDGKTWALLEHMLGTGIDGLHGIQPSVGMDMRLLKEKVGSRVTLFGAVEAETLINGTPEEVAQVVRYCLRHAAPGGGFVLTSGNSVQAGSRYENYMTMLRVARDEGVYPIK